MTTDGSYKRGRITAAGPTLAYEVVSSGKLAPTSPTLLCLHGNSSHRGVWRPVAERLRDHRSVLVDLRGFGDSDHVSPPAYNPEHHAADIAAVISAGLVEPPYAILAHSAAALAATHFIASARRSVEPVPTPEAFVWVDLDPLVPRWQVDYFHQGVASVARVFATVEDAIRPPLLPAIRCPALVLRGGDSIVTSAEGTAALRGRLPDHEFREVTGDSHMLLLEHPDVAAEAIRDFLRRRASQAA